MAHRLSPRARADIDDIAYYVAVESGSLELVGRVPLTVNRDGLVIGTNAILIQQVDGQLKITSIVVPRPDSDADLAPVAHPQDPRRVGIRIGPRPTQVAGSLAPGATDTDMVWIPKGMMLEVRLERVPNRAAVVRGDACRDGSTAQPEGRRWGPRRQRAGFGRRRLPHRCGTDPVRRA